MNFLWKWGRMRRKSNANKNLNRQNSQTLNPQSVQRRKSSQNVEDVLPRRQLIIAVNKFIRMIPRLKLVFSLFNQRSKWQIPFSTPTIPIENGPNPFYLVVSRVNLFFSLYQWYISLLVILHLYYFFCFLSIKEDFFVWKFCSRLFLSHQLIRQSLSVKWTEYKNSNM